MDAGLTATTVQIHTKGEMTTVGIRTLAMLR
jgi:hypothetical protein